MTAILVFLIIFVTLLFIIGVIIFLQAQKIFRQQKQVERGLKMVPIHISLPPPSDDIEGSGRDERDVNEEVISKAETVYNILASFTGKKNFKTNFYGHKHLAFEIISHDGFIDFYTFVPVSMIEVVKQALIGAYPTVKLTEKFEPNIFNKIGKSDAVLGGEMELKNSFAYPIAVYQEIKRDPILPILNSLSAFKKEDGAAIQILLKPANSQWTKIAHSIATNKRKGKDKSQGFIDFVKLIFTSFTKSPEDNNKEPHTLSSLDQSVVDSIDDKTRFPGFETNIRIIVSTDSLRRSKEILDSVTSTFSVFNSSSKNSLKFKKSDNIEELIENYISKSFNHNKKNEMIFNSVELATIFHFPNQKSLPNAQVKRQDSRQIDAPPNLPDKDGENVLLLGKNEFRGSVKPVTLSLVDRQRHLYAVGQTGVGKTTFLENLALQDMLNGNGFAFIDPHGDAVEKILSMTPANRVEDIIYFSPADMDRPMGLNLFEYKNPDEKDFIIQESINMLYKLYDPNHQGIMGPRYENFFRMSALTIMADPNGGTFIDIPKLFRDQLFVESKLKYVKENDVLDFWRKEVPNSRKSNDFGEVVAWVVAKFSAFSSNTMMRNMIGQTTTSFNIREIMDNNKILLVNLNRSKVGSLNSQLIGMILVMKFQEAAMSRSDIPEKDRKDFCLFVDEFQNFSTDSFADILSEARKYHLNLVVANQYTTQLSEEIRGAVFGNVGTVVSFRVGHDDAKILSDYFKPTFKEDDLIRLPNYNAVIRTMINGVPTQPFSMVGVPTLGRPNPKLGDALKKLSALKYGRDRNEVEREINERLSVSPVKENDSFQSFLNNKISSSNDKFSSSQFINDNFPTQADNLTSHFDLAKNINETSSNKFSQNNQKTNLPNSIVSEFDNLSSTSFLDSWLSKRKKNNLSSSKINNYGPHGPSNNKVNDQLSVENNFVSKDNKNNNDDNEFKIDRSNSPSSVLDNQNIKKWPNIAKEDFNNQSSSIKKDDQMFASNQNEQLLDEDTEILIDNSGRLKSKN